MFFESHSTSELRICRESGRVKTGGVSALIPRSSSEADASFSFKIIFMFLSMYVWLGSISVEVADDHGVVTSSCSITKVASMTFLCGFESTIS